MMYECTEAYRNIESKWRALTTAIVGISNLHSSPDLATAARGNSVDALLFFTGLAEDAQKKHTT